MSLLSCSLGETGSALLVLLEDKSQVSRMGGVLVMAMAQWLGRRRTSHQQTAGAAQRSCQRPDTGGGSMSHQVIRLNVMERETDLINRFDW